jgi:hypothetical protein
MGHTNFPSAGNWGSRLVKLTQRSIFCSHARASKHKALRYDSCPFESDWLVGWGRRWLRLLLLLNHQNIHDIQEGILSRNLVKKRVCDLVWFLWFVPRNCMGARIVSFGKKQKNTLTIYIYQRHQIVIAELEIGAAGADFSRRTSWWAREDPGRARTWKSMKSMHFLRCIQMHIK